MRKLSIIFNTIIFVSLMVLTPLGTGLAQEDDMPLVVTGDLVELSDTTVNISGVEFNLADDAEISELITVDEDIYAILEVIDGNLIAVELIDEETYEVEFEGDDEHSEEDSESEAEMEEDDDDSDDEYDEEEPLVFIGSLDEIGDSFIVISGLTLELDAESIAEITEDYELGSVLYVAIEVDEETNDLSVVDFSDDDDDFESDEDEEDGDDDEDEDESEDSDDDEEDDDSSEDESDDDDEDDDSSEDESDDDDEDDDDSDHDDDEDEDEDDD